MLGVLSSPMGIMRHNTSYDELMEAPMHSPPSDMSINILWKDPVIPKHNFRDTAEVSSCGDNLFFLCCCYKAGLDCDLLGKGKQREPVEF